ncbi:MAG: DUF4920 domain-containing protein [Bacteroidetes bacterium]|jgi:formylmethanofuran dehydrogenase subunit D|nr:DUF4920 domain-containing protein [Bacteroidota bacterium]
MKRILSLSIATLFCGVLLAQPPKGDANAGMTFGEKINAEGTIKADQLADKLEQENKIAVKVEGEVAQVCTAEGCWLKMKTSTGTIMVKMKDHKFLVPLSMNGKTIVVKGTAEKKETTVAQLKHYAEDAGKTKAEIDAIKEPKKETVIQAEGILVIK